MTNLYTFNEKRHVFQRDVNEIKFSYKQASLIYER